MYSFTRSACPFLRKLYFTALPVHYKHSLAILIIVNCTSVTAQVNLALNKPVTSSSTRDATTSPNSNLTDGNYATFVSTNNTQTGTNTEWFKIDLGADYVIEQIRIGSKPGSDNARRFLLVTQPGALPDLGTIPGSYKTAAAYNRLIYTNGETVTANANTQPFGITSPTTVPQAAGVNLGPAFPDNKIELNVGIHTARYILIMSLQDTYFDLAEIEVFPGPPAVRAFSNTGFEQGTTKNGSGQMVREAQVQGWSTTGGVAMNYDHLTIPTDGSFIELWSSGSQGVPAFEGNYFAELNAFSQSTMSQQRVCVLEGETFSFTLAHRGRNGVDVMRLLIDHQEVAEFSDNNEETGTHTGTILPAGTSHVTLEAPVINAAGWAKYSGTWANNSGETKAVSFGFQAVSSAGGEISKGNFLDAVSLTSTSTLVSFSSLATSGLEYVSTASLPKLLVNGELTSPASVEIEIAVDGSAIRGLDYTTTPASGPITVTIPAGYYDATDATAISLAPYIQIVKDAIINESPETILMTLNNPSGVAIGDASSCQTSNGTATYTIIDDVSITGNVFHDANGLVNNKVDGPGTNAGGVNAVLVRNNAVVATVSVGSDGVFEFPGAEAGLTYSVLVSSKAATVGQVPPSVLLPGGWINTGERNGVDEGGDGIVDGISAQFTPVSNVTNINFGIEQLPTPDDKNYIVAPSSFVETPSGGSAVTGYMGIPASSNALTGYVSGGSLTGSDPEDCAAAGSCHSGKTFIINSFNPTTRLFYDGTEILANGMINNFDINKLYIYGQNGSGNTSSPVGFTYSLQDAAAQNSPVPATYQITTDRPLPVTLVAFNASVTGELSVQLSWTTSGESNSNYFEVMYSGNAKDWAAAGRVAANGNTTEDFSYQFTHVSPFPGIRYYRLKMVDLDGTYAYSGIRTVTLIEPDKHYPNPVATELHVGSAEGTVVCIYDAAGRIRLKSKVAGGVVDVRTLSNGIYIVEITNPDSSKSASRIVVAK